jgi:hypothetical protein
MRAPRSPDRAIPTLTAQPRLSWPTATHRLMDRAVGGLVTHLTPVVGVPATRQPLRGFVTIPARDAAYRGRVRPVDISTGACRGTGHRSLPSSRKGETTPRSSEEAGDFDVEMPTARFRRASGRAATCATVTLSRTTGPPAATRRSETARPQRLRPRCRLGSATGDQPDRAPA